MLMPQIRKDNYFQEANKYKLENVILGINFVIFITNMLISDRVSDAKGV